MKTVLTVAVALAAVAASPALADEAALGHAGGECGFSQAMLSAMADGKQQQMDETKAKVDALIESALASTRTAQVEPSSEQAEQTIAR